MGQYYRAILLKEDEICKAFSPYDYDNGAKLMEHSYIGDYFVEAVERALTNKKYSLIWAGDYADEDYYSRPLSETFVKNEGENHIDDNTITPRYIINYSKKVYIDKNKLNNADNEGYIVHPLPILTCMGNGRGGGDYHGDNMKLVGTWAKDVISLTNEKENIPNDFNEMKVEFFYY